MLPNATRFAPLADASAAVYHAARRPQSMIAQLPISSFICLSRLRLVCNAHLCETGDTSTRNSKGHEFLWRNSTAKKLIRRSAPPLIHSVSASSPAGQRTLNGWRRQVCARQSLRILQQVALFLMVEQKMTHMAHMAHVRYSSSIRVGVSMRFVSAWTVLQKPFGRLWK